MNETEKEAQLLEFERKVLDTVKKYEMIKTCGKTSVLVGLSGGADSVSLLLSLCALKKSGIDLEISCAHVNHMIRGESADSDERFSENLCKRLGVPFFSAKIDIPSISKKLGKGTEETARDERYAFFDRVKSENGIELAATAHTASDNAETMIFNLARGASLDGLCGIPPKREGIIRPLILCTRTEVEEYLYQKGETYVTDETNLTDDYSRNLIRHAVIPKLKTVNPSLEKTLSESAELLRYDRDCLNDAAKREAEEGENCISRMPQSIAARVVRNAYRDFTGRELSGANLSEILRVSNDCLSDGLTKFVSCGSVFAAISPDAFSFVNEIPSAESYSVVLKEGLNVIKDGSWLVFLGEGDCQSREALHIWTSHSQNSYKLALHYSLFSDRISGNIIARSRLHGDSYTYGGMNRKLKKVFNGQKIKNAEKCEIPIICDDNGIILTGVTPVADRHCGVGGDLPIEIYKIVE